MFLLQKSPFQVGWHTNALYENRWFVEEIVYLNTYLMESKLYSWLYINKLYCCVDKGPCQNFVENSLWKKSFHMLALNKSFWSLDQNGLFKVRICNDYFFWANFRRNLDVVPNVEIVLVELFSQAKKTFYL